MIPVEYPLVSEDDTIDFGFASADTAEDLAPFDTKLHYIAVDSEGVFWLMRNWL